MLKIRIVLSLVTITLIGFFVFSTEKEVVVENYPYANQIDTLLHDGYIRTYKLYVSTSYSTNTEVALVIALHGYGNTATEMEKASGLNEKADSEGFIVVYPNGFNYSKDANETQYWNVRENSIGLSPRIDDVGFINQLIDLISNHYSIDENKIYATGFSNGASMCYHLGNSLSCKIAAIAPHSGYMAYKPNKVQKCKIPVLHLQGLKDGVVKYNASWLEQVLCLWGSDGECKQHADTVFQNADYTIKKWPSSGNCLYVSKEGRHDWFNTSNSGIQANDIIWEFFKAHPKEDY